jgi:hypothetical protein
VGEGVRGARAAWTTRSVRSPGAWAYRAKAFMPRSPATSREGSPRLRTGRTDRAAVSRYCIASGLITRATSKAVCAVFSAALSRYGARILVVLRVMLHVRRATRCGTARWSYLFFLLLCRQAG